MSTLNLDKRIELEITAVKGDTLGPIILEFDNSETDGDIENLTGAIFTGELYKGSTVEHTLSGDELAFDSSTSKLTLQIDASVTATFTSSLRLRIRQELNGIITTRVVGTITFNQ